MKPFLLGLVLFACMGCFFLLDAATTTAAAAGRRGSNRYHVNVNHHHHPQQKDPDDAKFSTVYLNQDTNEYVLKSGIKDPMHGLAWGYLTDEIDTTGWSRLSITSNPDVGTPEQQMYAAGYLEGALTGRLIYYNWLNVLNNEYNSSEPSAAFKDFVNTNYAWMQTMIQQNPDDSYWVQVNLVLQQLAGMVAGYNAFAGKGEHLDLFKFLMLNLDGDMDALGRATSGVIRDFSKMTMEQVQAELILTDHCSALFKITDDYSEIFAGHTTWSGYDDMLRVFKSYTLPTVGSASKTVLFSSYPGFLSSVDDFYVTDSQLAVIETTNGILNDTLLQLITPQSVFSWLRVIVANRMANSGPQWVQVFSRYNSGTYNNQWMILDYKLFTPGQELAPNTLWVLEQIPGYIESQDVTSYLALGYWPSYNIPFFPKIFELSGFPAMVEKYGDWFTYERNPRANIYHRDAHKVVDIQSMKAFMQYNNWQHDPLSQGNAGNAVASRFDLVNSTNLPNPYLDQQPFGGIDSKITSYELIQQGLCYGISGPTHDQQPPFVWDDNFPDVMHVGQPNEFNFDWQQFSMHDI